VTVANVTGIVLVVVMVRVRVGALVTVLMTAYAGVIVIVKLILREHFVYVIVNV
jgi:hypothetical protein